MSHVTSSSILHPKNTNYYDAVISVLTSKSPTVLPVGVGVV